MKTSDRNARTTDQIKFLFIYVWIAESGKAEAIKQ